MAQLKNTIVNDTGFLRLPLGSSAQRPSSPVAGYIRFNTTINLAEYWNGSSWIAIDNSELFYFVSASFTNGSTFADARIRAVGAQGRFGPSLAQARNAMFDNIDNVVLRENTSFFNVVNGIQQLSIPQSGVYRIEARGAQGGHATSTNNAQPNRPGGRGAIIRGDVFLEKGELIKIVVGQEGIGRQSIGFNDPFNERAGGGGGSFVWKDSGDLPLICAGGGGAASGDPSVGVNGRDANTGTSGGISTNGSGVGGTNGNGGISQGGSFRAGAGAGFLSDGQGGGDGKDGRAIIRASDAAIGGSCDPSSGLNFDGGFGGGGADARLNSTSDDSEGTGGGGGYSGGAGGNSSLDDGGGGGGSFIINTATNVATSNGGFSRTGAEPHPAYTGTVFNLNAWNAAHGLVSITRIG